MRNHKMKPAYLIATVGAISIGLLTFFLSRDSEKPNFDKIVKMSGADFRENPKVLRWMVETSGPFSSDQVTIVEYRIASADSDIVNHCTRFGYTKGVPDGAKFFLGIEEQPKNLQDVCWKRIEDEGNHFFALYDDVFVYRLIL